MSQRDPQRDKEDEVLGAVGILGLLGAGIYFYGGDMLHFIGRSPGWDILPAASSVAQAVWQGLGILGVFVGLAAVYFHTGLAGRRCPSGAHGFAGILTGFTVLAFVAAYPGGLDGNAAGAAKPAQRSPRIRWVSLLGGIAASVIIKLLSPIGGSA